MSFVVCTVPVAPMRKEAAHRSEMVSQLLFGEFAEIVEEEKEFVLLKCMYDGYEGWCQRSQLTVTKKEEILQTDCFTNSFSNKILINKLPVVIPFGCPVYGENTTPVTFGNSSIDYNLSSTTIFKTETVVEPEKLRHTAFQFLNTPYLWGGKSVFGIDCSGFVQQVFKLFGIALLRDAYLQATQGSSVENLAESRLGDLAFFTNEAGRIVHVGLLLSNNQIIHAAGKVRVDSIDATGIITAKGIRTHTLHSIRRYLSI